VQSRNYQEQRKVNMATGGCLCGEIRYEAELSDWQCECLPRRRLLGPGEFSTAGRRTERL